MGGKKLERTRFMNQVVISQPLLTGGLDQPLGQKARICTSKFFRRGYRTSLASRKDRLLNCSCRCSVCRISRDNSVSRRSGLSRGSFTKRGERKKPPSTDLRSTRKADILSSRAAE